METSNFSDGEDKRPIEADTSSIERYLDLAPAFAAATLILQKAQDSDMVLQGVDGGREKRCVIRFAKGVDDDFPHRHDLVTLTRKKNTPTDIVLIDLRFSVSPGDDSNKSPQSIFITSFKDEDREQIVSEHIFTPTEFGAYGEEVEISTDLQGNIVAIDGVEHDEQFRAERFQRRLDYFELSHQTNVDITEENGPPEAA